MTSERRLTTLLITAAILFLLLFAAPLFLGEVYTEHDVGSIFLPLRFFYAQCLASGDSFLWIPHIYSGLYLQGEGQTGMTHPLHWALYKYLPFTAAFDLEFILSYPFMFVGMVLFLRRWKLPPPAVYFGAFLYAFSGYSMSSWLWMVHIAVLAHTPWLLWCIDIAMREKNRRRVAWAVLGIVVLTASQLLVSYPQMVYVTGLVEGIYALSLIPLSRRRWMLGVLLGAKVLAIVCAAIQILPTLEAVQHSTRADADAAFRLQQSLHPANLLCLVNPYLFQQRMYDAYGYQGIYGGTTVTILALWLLSRWRRLSVPRVPVACFALVALLGAVLTLGKYGLLYTWTSSLPVLEYFRGPPRHGAMFHAGWVGLAAFGLAELILSRDAMKRREWALLLALPIVSALPVIFIVLLRMRGELSESLAAIENQFAPTLNPIVGFVVMLAAIAAFAACRKGWRYGLLALILITIADQGLYHLRHRTTDNLEEFIAAIDVPDAPPEHRIEPNWLPVHDVNGPLMKDYRMVAGLVSIEPERALDYLVDPYTLQLAGTKWMRARIGTNEELNAYAEQGITWIELPNPMPRARLVSKVIVSTNPATDLRTIDYETFALVETPLDLEDAPPGTARVTEDRPGHITIETNATTRQLLITTESYHPGWRITIDDVTTDPTRIYGDFLGVAVDPGQHTVTLHFDPWSWQWGVRLTVFGSMVVALAALALLGSQMNREGNPKTSNRHAE